MQKHTRHLPRLQTTCRCSAYKFPHRQDAGACRSSYICPHGIDREEERCRTCEFWDRCDVEFERSTDR